MKKINPVLSMLLCVTMLMFLQPAAFAWNGTDPSQHNAVGIGDLADPADWIADEWRPVGIGGGGAVFHPTTSPIQPGLIMASCDMGGAYISYDSGATWSMINFGSTASWTEAWAFTFDLNDPNIIYASRGNAGLYQTKDMGTTWKRIFPNEDESITKHRGDHADVYYVTDNCTKPGCDHSLRTVDDPGDGELAADWVGYPKCDPPGGYPYQGRVSVAAVDPENSNNVWVIVEQARGQNAATQVRDHLYYSSDCGETFTLLAEDLSTYSATAGYPFNNQNITTTCYLAGGLIVDTDSDPDNRDVLAFYGPGFDDYGGVTSQIWRVTTSTGARERVIPQYNGAAVPGNITMADFLYDRETGKIIYYYNSGGYLYKSTDGLKTVERLGRGILTLAGSAKESSVSKFGISSEDVIWYSNGQNIFKSADGGATFTHVWRGFAGRPGTALDQDRWIGFGEDGRGWQEDAVQFGAAWSSGNNGFCASKTDPDFAGLSNNSYLIVTRNGGDLWGQTYSQIVHGYDDKGNQVDTWITSGINVTTTYGVHFDPFNPKHVFLSITDVGLFQSWDGGYSWRHSGISGMFPKNPPANSVGNGDNFGNWSNTCYWIAFDPVVPDRVYGAWAATHDVTRLRYFPERNGSAETGVGGVAVSEDGGRTWQPVNFTDATAAASGLPKNVTPMHIEVGPVTDAGTTLYIATHGSGFFKSVDSGLHWIKINNGINPVEHKYAQNKTLEGNNGKSVKWPWPEEYSYFGRKIVYVDDGTPDGVLYATIARSGSEFVGEASGQIYKSVDGGENWSMLPMPGNAIYVTDFAYDPEDTDTIYASCWQSTNGNPNYIMCDPEDERYNSGGVYVSKDAGESWQLLWGADRHVYGIQVDPYNSSNLFAVTFEGQLMVSEDKGSTWTQLYGFDFRQAHSPFIDPNHPDFLFVTSFGGNIWHGPSGVSPKLSGITIDGLLIDGFDKDVFEYTVTVPDTTALVNVDAEGIYHTAGIDGTGEVALEYGDNALSIAVTNEQKTLSNTYTVNIIRAKARASACVTKDIGNTNTLKITVTEERLDGTLFIDHTETFTIDNNAKGTYQVGPYSVFVATSGNTKVTSCYIVE